MIATLTVVGFFVAVAWLQQWFLNRMIKADLEALEKLKRDRSNTVRDRARSPQSSISPKSPVS